MLNSAGKFGQQNYGKFFYFCFFDILLNTFETGIFEINIHKYSTGLYEFILYEKITEKKRKIEDSGRRYWIFKGFFN